MDPFDIDGPGDAKVGLAAPAGTVILVDGAPPTEPVTLSVVPVPARQVPMALEPESGHVGLRVLKDHENPDVSELHVALDPKSLLLVRS